MSSTNSPWKLVEATPIIEQQAANNNNNINHQHPANPVGSGAAGGHEGGGAWHGGRGGRGQGRGGRGGRGGRAGRGHFNFPKFSTLSEEDRARLIEEAMVKIDSVFEKTRLNADEAFRQLFDEAGYIPIATVCNAAQLNGQVPLQEISKRLQTVERFEIDVENETMRLKENWNKWLMPMYNPYVGAKTLGCPRYIKVPPMAPQPAGVFAFPPDMFRAPLNPNTNFGPSGFHVMHGMGGNVFNMRQQAPQNMPGEFPNDSTLHMQPPNSYLQGFPQASQAVMGAQLIPPFVNQQQAMTPANPAPFNKHPNSRHAGAGHHINSSHAQPRNRNTNQAPVPNTFSLQAFPPLSSAK